MRKWTTFFPVLDWSRRYNTQHFTEDGVAALIVTIMLIPQSLAYALLAGLPAHIGLYASILPLIAYTIFGTSSALAVGPVAVVSLMTAAAISNLGITDPQQILLAAATLAILSGLMLVLMGVLRLGFLANFLSHPVISGFISASAIVIATSQLKHLFGVDASGHNLAELVVSLGQNIGSINWYTVMVGIPAVIFLFWVRSGLKSLLLRLGIGEKSAALATKLGPVIIVFCTILSTKIFGLDEKGVAIVGAIPQGLPALGLPEFDGNL